MRGFDNIGGSTMTGRLLLTGEGLSIIFFKEYTNKIKARQTGSFSELIFEGATNDCDLWQGTWAFSKHQREAEYSGSWTMTKDYWKAELNLISWLLIIEKSYFSLVHLLSDSITERISEFRWFSLLIDISKQSALKDLFRPSFCAFGVKLSAACMEDVWMFANWSWISSLACSTSNFLSV